MKKSLFMFVTSVEYFDYTATLVINAIKLHKDNNIRCKVIIDDMFSPCDTSKKEYFNKFKNIYESFVDIELFSVSYSKFFSQKVLDAYYGSIVRYPSAVLLMRFLAPSFLEEYKEILFLEADMLIVENLLDDKKLNGGIAVRLSQDEFWIKNAVHVLSKYVPELNLSEKEIWRFNEGFIYLSDTLKEYKLFYSTMLSELEKFIEIKNKKKISAFPIAEWFYPYVFNLLKFDKNLVQYLDLGYNYVPHLYKFDGVKKVIHFCSAPIWKFPKYQSIYNDWTVNYFEFLKRMDSQRNDLAILPKDLLSNVTENSVFILQYFTEFGSVHDILLDNSYFVKRVTNVIIVYVCSDLKHNSLALHVSKAKNNIRLRLIFKKDYYNSLLLIANALNLNNKVSKNSSHAFIDFITEPTKIKLIVKQILFLDLNCNGNV